MPVLEKQRHELFCIGIAKGLTPAESYLQAGYSPKGAHSSAWKLRQNPTIATRIAELQTLTANRAAGIPDLTNIELAIMERDGQARVKYERWKYLCQIRDERAANYSDPTNEMVRRLTGTQPGAKPDLRKLPGIKTGYVVIEMKLLGKTAVPTLRQDNALLRELSNIESEIAQLMGFLKPINLNIDARTHTQINNNDNRLQVQIVKIVSSPADEKGQW